TITFPVIEEKTYGDATFTLGNAATDQGLTVTYTPADPAVVSISGNQASILKAGTTTITATQAGDDLNFAAEQKERVLLVAKTSLTITSDSISKIFGDSDPLFTANFMGFVNNDDESDLAGKLSFIREAGESVGSYEITPSGLTSLVTKTIGVGTPGPSEWVMINQWDGAKHLILIDSRELQGDFDYSTLKGIEILDVYDGSITYFQNLGSGPVFWVGYYIYTDLTNAIVNSAFSSSIRDLGSDYALSIDFSFETSNSDNYNIEFLPGTLEINTKSVNHEEITMSDLEDLTYSGIEQDPKPVLNDGSYV